MLRRNPDRFRALPDNADFISSRGHRGFNRTAEELRSASEIGEGIFAEINLFRERFARYPAPLLVAFEIPATDLRLFLREDRDAARGRVTGNYVAEGKFSVLVMLPWTRE